ncbi:MAG: hypothetical protein ACYSUI_15915 [Planctomycetota bacterium]|jgi:hypothetical protein
MIWAPDYSLIRSIRASGTGNMGTLLDRSDTTARFRFAESEPIVLTSMHVAFTGSGDQGSATLKMLLDHHTRTDGLACPFDFTIDEWDACGYNPSTPNAVKAYVNWYPVLGEHHVYTYPPGSQVVFTWTDPGTTDWGIELKYQPWRPPSVRE